MKRILFILVVSIVITRLWFSDRPSIEPDEGFYLNTFYTVSQGNFLYKTTFFSQPPGFFLLTYPGYVLFGKTLQAVRLSIFFWSLFGLAGIFWLAYELRQRWIAFIAVGTLFLISRYYNEIITFHADALPLVFSCLSLASMIRFFNNGKIQWFLLSIGLFITAFWIKFDFSIILPLTYIFLIKIVKSHYTFKKISWLLINTVLVVIVLSYLYLSQFNLHKMYLDVVQYHIQAQLYYPFSLWSIFFSFKSNLDLFLVLIIISFLAVINIKKIFKNFSYTVLFLWSFNSL